MSKDKYIQIADLYTPAFSTSHYRMILCTRSYLLKVSCSASEKIDWIIILFIVIIKDCQLNCNFEIMKYLKLLAKP